MADYSHTTFETQRGISSVLISKGHALVVVAGIAEADLPERRLRALNEIAAASLSIDFFKLSLDGFSFVIPEEDAAKAERVLRTAGFEAKVTKDRAIITVSAPNIRDESGLVARVAEFVVRAGAPIDSVGDMHSSVLIVTDSEHADTAFAALRDTIGKVDII